MASRLWLWPVVLALLFGWWTSVVPPTGIGGETSCNNPVEGLVDVIDGFPFTCGLHRVTSGGTGPLEVYAYVQPNGSWCWSNSGIIVNKLSKESILVDTLTDERLTNLMLSDMKPILDQAPLKTLVHTHGDIDHVYGNGAVANLVDSIVISKSGAPTMLEKLPNPKLYAVVTSIAQHIWYLVGNVDNLTLSPGFVRTLNSLNPRVKEPLIAILGFFRATLWFQPFVFSKVTWNAQTWAHLIKTFEGSEQVQLGDETVELLQTKPSHSYGDAVLLVRSARVVFTGDLLLGGSSPIMWHGPVQNMLDSLDFLLALPVDYYIPGHGPVFKADFVRLQREYWVYVQVTAAKCLEDSLDSDACGLKALKGLPHQFHTWGDRERMLTNIWVEFNQLVTQGQFKVSVADKLKQLGKMGRYVVKQELA